jgi:hypothetical protein
LVSSSGCSKHCQGWAVSRWAIQARRAVAALEALADDDPARLAPLLAASQCGYDAMGLGMGPQRRPSRRR